MTSVLLVGELCARATMKIHDDIDVGVFAPANKSIEIFESTAREMLAVLHEIFFQPEAHGDSHSIQSQAGNLFDVVLGCPRIPVFLECCVGRVLAKLLDTLPLIV